MTESPWAGIYAPVVTPFDSLGALDLAGLRRNLQGYAAAPLAGYVVLGTNGEFTHLDREEKEAVIAAAVDESGARPVIAQVGEGSLYHSLALARRAADLGAAALLAVTPHYYNNQVGEAGLLDYYTALADGAGLPVLIYSIPQNTGVAVTPAFLQAAAAHPGIVGIKDSAGNLGRLAEMVEGTPPGFGVLNGSSALLVAAFACGCPGAVLAAADVLPFEICDLFALCRDGQWERAMAAEARLRPVVRAMSRLGVGGIKLGMDLVGYRGGDVRRPLRSPSAEAREALADTLRTAGLIRF